MSSRWMMGECTNTKSSLWISTTDCFLRDDWLLRGTFLAFPCGNKTNTLSSWFIRFWSLRHKLALTWTQSGATSRHTWIVLNISTPFNTVICLANENFLITQEFRFFNFRWSQVQWAVIHDIELQVTGLQTSHYATIHHLHAQTPPPLPPHLLR